VGLIVSDRASTRTYDAYQLFFDAGYGRASQDWLVLPKGLWRLYGPYLVRALDSAMRKLKLTESCQAFLKALADTGRVGGAAAVAGTSRTQVYKLRQRNPLFAAAWQQALESSDDPPPQTVDRGFRARSKLAAH
jgi:hypothetical protein